MNNDIYSLPRLDKHGAQFHFCPTQIKLHFHTKKVGVFYRLTCVSQIHITNSQHPYTATIVYHKIQRFLKFFSQLSWEPRFMISTQGRHKWLCFSSTTVLLSFNVTRYRSLSLCYLPHLNCKLVFCLVLFSKWSANTRTHAHTHALWQALLVFFRNIRYLFEFKRYILF